MELKEALAPEVTLEDFFVEKVPSLFEARRELFTSAYDTSIIVSVFLSDTGQRYTVEFRPDGCTVEDDEMIDFPVVTLVGSSQTWDSVKRHILKIAEPLEHRAKKTAPPRKITRAFLDDFERFDGEFIFEIDADDLDEAVSFKLVLNDYQAPAGAPVVRVRASFELGEKLARDEIDLAELESSVQVRGDMSLGVDVVGFILEHFPHLNK